MRRLWWWKADGDSDGRAGRNENDEGIELGCLGVVVGLGGGRRSDWAAAGAAAASRDRRRKGDEKVRVRGRRTNALRGVGRRESCWWC